MITAREMVRNAGMSDRPEYYSGRRASRGDLNGEMLHNIYIQIKTEQGEGPAKEFVSMVENLQSLATTNFLNALYTLEQKGWKNSNYQESSMDLGSDSRERDVLSFATVVSAMTSRPDETAYIKEEFWMRLGKI